MTTPSTDRLVLALQISSALATLRFEFVMSGPNSPEYEAAAADYDALCRAYEAACAA